MLCDLSFLPSTPCFLYELWVPMPRRHPPGGWQYPLGSGAVFLEPPSQLLYTSSAAAAAAFREPPLHFKAEETGCPKLGKALLGCRKGCFLAVRLLSSGKAFRLI